MQEPIEELTPALKKRLVLSSLFALTIGSMMLLNLDTFLPLYCEKVTWTSNNSVSNFEVSIIIAIFALTQIIFAPFNSIIKNKMGSKNTILFGFLLMTLTTFGLGFISYSKDAKLFLGVSIFLRFFQGMGDILLQITILTVIT